MCYNDLLSARSLHFFPHVFPFVVALVCSACTARWTTNPCHRSRVYYIVAVVPCPVISESLVLSRRGHPAVVATIQLIYLSTCPESSF